MSYLDEAAALLRQVRDGNEARAQQAAEWAAVPSSPNADIMLREVNDRRMEIAAAFTRLAAIEHGLAPAFEVPGEGGPAEPRPRLRAPEPQEGE